MSISDGELLGLLHIAICNLENEVMDNVCRPMQNDITQYSPPADVAKFLVCTRKLISMSYEPFATIPQELLPYVKRGLRCATASAAPPCSCSRPTTR